jgi:hypothetical protein
VLPDFASLLCIVSPDLVEPSPGGSKAGTGPVVSSVAPVSGMPPRRVPAQQVVPQDSVPTVPGWDQAAYLTRCLPDGVCWSTTQLSPLSWVLSHPRMSGSHLTIASTPDCRPGRILRLSLEVTSVQGTGRLLRIGMGPETHGSPGDIWTHGSPPSAYSLAGSSASTRGPFCGAFWFRPLEVFGPATARRSATPA